MLVTKARTLCIEILNPQQYSFSNQLSLKFFFFLSQKMLGQKRWVLFPLRPRIAYCTNSPDQAIYEWPKEATKLIFRFYMTCDKNSLKYLKLLYPGACYRSVCIDFWTHSYKPGWWFFSYWKKTLLSSCWH